MVDSSEGGNMKEKLLQLRELLGDAYVDLLHAYLSDAPERMEAMVQALDEGDMDKLENAAHTFKGSSSNMGAMELAALCEEVIKFSQAGVQDQLREKIEQIRRQYQNLDKLLQSELASCQ
jgi:HPt (histidine-containing phosphotransfer) domain-containing protein